MTIKKVHFCVYLEISLYINVITDKIIITIKIFFQLLF